MSMFDALANDHNNKIIKINKRVQEEATRCPCGKSPYLQDQPTLSGRSQHVLICNCGESGVVIFDGDTHTNTFVDKAIDGWNNRESYKIKGITEISIRL